MSGSRKSRKLILVPDQSVERGQNSYLAGTVYCCPRTCNSARCQQSIRTLVYPIQSRTLALQTEPEPILTKLEIGIQQDVPLPVVMAPPFLVDYGVDPVVKPSTSGDSDQRVELEDIQL